METGIKNPSSITKHAHRRTYLYIQHTHRRTKIPELWCLEFYFPEYYNYKKKHLCSLGLRIFMFMTMYLCKIITLIFPRGINISTMTYTHKRLHRLSVLIHTFDPSTQKQRQVEPFEFKATLVYIVSSRQPGLHSKTLLQK